MDKSGEWSKGREEEEQKGGSPSRKESARRIRGRKIKGDGLERSKNRDNTS
jgi:hypothetical protein